MTRMLAILTVRNEGAFLLEWLAHHRAVGFTDFLVFSNDCQDGTDLILDRLAELGWLCHIRNNGPHPEGPQWAALKAADKHPLRAAADWILCLDIDEFVNIHVGDNTLQALLAALPDATAIPLTWRLFGNDGVVDHEGRPVTATFTRAAPPVLWWPWRALLFKTLFRNDGSYAKLGVHRPRSPAAGPGRPARWFDGSGQELAGAFLTTRVFSEPGQDHFRLAQMNHYALGSMHNYLLKCDRGRANRDASNFDMAYWVDRNFSDVEDRSVLRLADRSAPLLAALHADQVLAPLSEAALRWRSDRFRQLMAEEPWRALFGRLLIAPPSRILPAETARAIRQYAKP